MNSSGLLHRLFYSVLLGGSWGLGFIGLISAVALKLGWIPAWMTLYASPRGCLEFAGAMCLFFLATDSLRRAEPRVS